MACETKESETPEEEAARLRKAIEDYLSGNYPHPRHGTFYWQECESCNLAHFEAALAGPAALSPKEQTLVVDEDALASHYEETDRSW